MKVYGPLPRLSDRITKDGEDIHYSNFSSTSIKRLTSLNKAAYDDKWANYSQPAKRPRIERYVETLPTELPSMQTMCALKKLLSNENITTGTTLSNNINECFIVNNDLRKNPYAMSNSE